MSEDLTKRLRDHAGLLRRMDAVAPNPQTSEPTAKLLDAAATEIERLHEIYISAVNGRRDMRAALREERDTGWVVEGAWSDPSEPQYWCGSSLWSSNNLQALRFARRHDAQQAADAMCAGMNVRICEHVWL